MQDYTLYTTILNGYIYRAMSVLLSERGVKELNGYLGLQTTHGIIR